LDRDKNSEQICQIFDIATSTLDRWVKLGCPCEKDGSGKDRKYNEAEIAAWKAANRKTGRVGRPTTVIGEKLAALKAKKEALLIRLFEMDVAEREKKLVEREQVERETLAKIALVRSKLQQMGAAIAPRLEGLTTAERQQVIDEYCRQLCEDFARA
jgi:phage terminase Nu1 subunit (DNA packaging protein)